MSTVQTPEQLNIDLAFRRTRVQTLINEQMREYAMAFGIVEAPSDATQARCAANYWMAEKALQENLTAIAKIKEQLAS